MKPGSQSSERKLGAFGLLLPAILVRQILSRRGLAASRHASSPGTANSSQRFARSSPFLFIESACKIFLVCCINRYGNCWLKAIFVGLKHNPAGL